MAQPVVADEDVGDDKELLDEELQMELDGGGGVWGVTGEDAVATEATAFNRRKLLLGAGAVLLAVSLLLLAVALFPRSSDPPHTTTRAHTVTEIVVPPRCATTPSTPPGQVVSPKYSKVEYRIVVLPNGIPIALASDPLASRAAAGVDMGVGSLSDPREFYGLAHFNEHMLFLGSERYPSESMFGDVLQSYAGRSNAYTDRGHTNYFFDLAPEGLGDVLDIFAGFFDSPLFNSSSVAREVEAIDNENSKNVGSDPWRRFQLTRSVSSPDTPYNSFATGNSGTLDRPGVRDALVKFFNSYYASDNMGVAVLAAAPLDTLQAAAEKSFSPIKAKQAAKPEWENHPETFPQPFPAGFINKMFVTKPASSTRELAIYWPLPFSAEWVFPSTPGIVLTQLLGQEQDGGLAAVLRKAGLVNSLKTDISSQSYSWFSLPGIVLSLTEEGEKRVDDIISTVYAFITLVSSELSSGKAKLEQWFPHLRNAYDVRWTLGGDGDAPMRTASSLAESLRRLHNTTGCVNHLLQPPGLFTFDEEVERKFLTFLRADNSLVLLRSQTAFASASAAQETASVKTEEWYNIKYIESSTAGKPWGGSASPFSASLSLPSTNGIFSVDLDEVDSLTEPPPSSTRGGIPAPSVFKEDGVSLSSSLEGFSGQTVFREPIGELRVRILRKAPVDLSLSHNIEEPLDAVRRKVVSKAVAQSLRYVAAEAASAALDFSVSLHLDYIDLRVTGVVTQHAVLLGHILGALKKPFVDTTSFLSAKSALEDDLGAWSTQFLVLHQAVQIAVEELTPSPSNDQLSEAVSNMTEADVGDVFSAYTTGACQMLLVSNANDRGRGLVYRGVAEALQGAGACGGSVAETQVSQPQHRMLKITEWHVLRLRNPSPVDKNDCALDLYQLGLDTVEMEAKARMLEQLVHQDAFTQLRTVEALGYAVFCLTRVRSGVWVLLCGVQGNGHGAEYLNARVQDFLAVYEGRLAQMPESDFSKFASALGDQLAAAPASVTSEASPIWREITSRGKTWDRVSRVEQAVRSLTRADMVAFFKQHITNTFQRRVLSVQMFHTAPPFNVTRQKDMPNVPQGGLPRVVDVRGAMRQMTQETW